MHLLFFNLHLGGFRHSSFQFLFQKQQRVCGLSRQTIWICIHQFHLYLTKPHRLYSLHQFLVFLSLLLKTYVWSLGSQSSREIQALVLCNVGSEASLRMFLRNEGSCSLCLSICISNYGFGGYLRTKLLYCKLYRYLTLDYWGLHFPKPSLEMLYRLDDVCRGC